MTPPDLTVRDVMLSEPIMVGPDAVVGDVLLLMNERRAGCVLVCDDRHRLVGIFTERDLLTRVADAVIGWRQYPVTDWMTADPHTIGPDAGWEEAVSAMARHRVRHLPVVDGGAVVGVLTSRMFMARRAEYLNQRVAERTAELRKVNDELIARDAEAAYNLRAAGKLQRWFLPQAAPDWAELRWAVGFRPLHHLGGDYYDFARPDGDHLGFLIADASGHGIAAAMVAIMARFAFGEVAAHATSPGKVLTELNRRLVGATGERFLTAFYGVFDRRSRTLRYATAGHPPPLRVEAATGCIHPLGGSGFLVGIIPDEVYAEREVRLTAGDVLCFYTDGLVESRNEIGEQYGEGRLERCLAAHPAADPGTLVNEVLACQKRFTGGVPLEDDLTVAVCRVG